MIFNKMMKRNIAVILFSSIALSACAKSTNNIEQGQTASAKQNPSSEQ